MKVATNIPVPPPFEVTLTLTKEEAIHLLAMIGGTTHRDLEAGFHKSRNNFGVMWDTNFPAEFSDTLGDVIRPLMQR